MHFKHPFLLITLLGWLVASHSSAQPTQADDIPTLTTGSGLWLQEYLARECMQRREQVEALQRELQDAIDREQVLQDLLQNKTDAAPSFAAPSPTDVHPALKQARKDNEALLAALASELNQILDRQLAYETRMQHQLHRTQEERDTFAREKRNLELNAEKIGYELNEKSRAINTLRAAPPSAPREDQRIQLEMLKQEIEKLNEENVALNTLNSKSAETVARAEDRANRTRTELVALEARVAERDESRVRSAGELARCRTELDETTARREALTAALKESEEQLALSTEKLATILPQSEQRQQRLQVETTARREAERILAQEKIRTEAALVAKRDAVEELQELRSELQLLQESETKRAALETKLRGLNEKVQTLTAALATSRSQARSQTEDVAALEAERNRFKALSTEKDVRLSAQREELEQRRKLIEAFSRTVLDMKDSGDSKGGSPNVMTRIQQMNEELFIQKQALVTAEKKAAELARNLLEAESKLAHQSAERLRSQP